MTYIAIQEQLDGKAVGWIEPIAYEQYLAGINFECKETRYDYLDE